MKQWIAAAKVIRRWKRKFVPARVTQACLQVTQRAQPNLVKQKAALRSRREHVEQCAGKPETCLSAASRWRPKHLRQTASGKPRSDRRMSLATCEQSTWRPARRQPEFFASRNSAALGIAQTSFSSALICTSFEYFFTKKYKQTLPLKQEKLTGPPRILSTRL